MRISDWSSDVCSSDLLVEIGIGHDDAMVLRAAHRLDALSVRDAAVIDIMRDVRRADEAERADEIGRASCRERVCRYVCNSVVAESLKKETSFYNSDTKIIYITHNT